MLFPVFARARESARKIQCLSNVKNIALAVQMYLTDYDRLWPNEHRAEVNANAHPSNPTATNGCALSAGTLMNPFLQTAVILDEYVKNRDVYNCPSARASGVHGITNPEGMDWWKRVNMIDPTTWGSYGVGQCSDPYPPGWGGTITDSMAQNSMSGDNTNAVETTICFAENGLTNAKTSQVPDVSNCVVAGDSSIYANILGVDDMMYSLCRLGCGGADWVNCPDTQDCGLGEGLVDRWNTDPSFRAKYTRHMGGGNVGFADGHAAWFNADALAAITPYCECCSDETGYSGSTMHSEGRPIRGLCPFGLG